MPEITDPTPAQPRSWKVGCKSRLDEPWAYNALRFKTKEGAESYGFGLYMRWTALAVYEVHESDDEPNQET